MGTIPTTGFNMTQLEDLRKNKPQTYAILDRLDLMTGSIATTNIKIKQVQDSSLVNEIKILDIEERLKKLEKGKP